MYTKARWAVGTSNVDGSHKVCLDVNGSSIVMDTSLGRHIATQILLNCELIDNGDSYDDDESDEDSGPVQSGTNASERESAS